MSGSLEATSVSAPAIEPVRFEAVRAQSEEPDPRALLLSRALLAPEHARRESIHDIIFQKHTGVLLLGLKQRKVIPKVMNRGQMTEMKEAGFRPTDSMHITVLDSDNAGLVLDAFEGQRKQLARVEAEAHRMDWRWRPIGEPFAFRGKKSCAVKVISYVDCPGVEEFYGLLEENLPGLELDRDPPHVTLMYRRQKKGKLAPKVGGISMHNPVESLDAPQSPVELEEAA